MIHTIISNFACFSKDEEHGLVVLVAVVSREEKD